MKIIYEVVVKKRKQDKGKGQGLNGCLYIFLFFPILILNNVKFIKN